MKTLSQRHSRQRLRAAWYFIAARMGRLERPQSVYPSGPERVPCLALAR